MDSAQVIFLIYLLISSSVIFTFPPLFSPNAFYKFSNSAIDIFYENTLSYKVVSFCVMIHIEKIKQSK